MEEHEDLEARLRAMADQPVDPAVASQHLTKMAVVRPSTRMARKLQIAAAFLAGLLLGGSGLAAAGALPDQAQHVAHTTLDKVGIDVPDPERYHGPECGAEVKRNHGAYVRDDKDLAKSRCGKPMHAGQGDDGDEADGTDDAGSTDKGEKGPCQGPPPWAGKDGKSMTPEEKAAAQAARAQACGDDADGDEGEDADETDADAEAQERSGDPEPEEQGEDATTTTTEAPTTTTEATTTTTTTTLAPNEQDPPTGA